MYSMKSTMFSDHSLFYFPWAGRIQSGPVSYREIYIFQMLSCILCTEKKKMLIQCKLMNTLLSRPRINELYYTFSLKNFILSWKNLFLTQTQHKVERLIFIRAVFSMANFSILSIVFNFHLSVIFCFSFLFLKKTKKYSFNIFLSLFHSVAVLRIAHSWRLQLLRKTLRTLQNLCLGNHPWMQFSVKALWVIARNEQSTERFPEWIGQCEHYYGIFIKVFDLIKMYWFRLWSSLTSSLCVFLTGP